MKLVALKDFSWAFGGTQIRAFAAGESIETDDQDLITVSTKEGWAREERAAAPSENKALKKAPSNKGRHASPDHSAG